MKMGLGNMGGIKGLERAQDAQTITALTKALPIFDIIQEIIKKTISNITSPVPAILKRSPGRLPNRLLINLDSILSSFR